MLAGVNHATSGFCLSLWWNTDMMTGAGTATLDPEVEAMNKDEKAKQEREPGFCPTEPRCFPNG